MGHRAILGRMDRGGRWEGAGIASGIAVVGLESLAPLLCDSRISSGWKRTPVVGGLPLTVRDGVDGLLVATLMAGVILIGLVFGLAVLVLTHRGARKFLAWIRERRSRA